MRHEFIDLHERLGEHRWLGYAFCILSCLFKNRCLLDIVFLFLLSGLYYLPEHISIAYVETDDLTLQTIEFGACLLIKVHGQKCLIVPCSNTYVGQNVRVIA